MDLPEKLKMTLVDKVDPDGGAWWQHQRDESCGVGVVITGMARGAPTTEEWYADGMLNQIFTSYAELRKAAAKIEKKYYAEVVSRYPFISELEQVANPGPGHAVPKCSVNTGQVATHVGQVAEGWYRQRSTVVYLGASAMRKLKKERHPAFILAAIKQHREARRGADQ